MKNEIWSSVSQLIKLADRLDSENRIVLANETDYLIKQIIKKADEDGSYMSVQNLKSIHEHSAEILKIINEKSVLPDWLESKINRASSDILSVSEYLKYGNKEEHEESEDDKEDDDSEMESDILDNYIDDGILEKNINNKIKPIDRDIDRLKKQIEIAIEKENEESEVKFTAELCSVYLNKKNALRELMILSERNAKYKISEELYKMSLDNEKELKNCEADLKELNQEY